MEQRLAGRTADRRSSRRKASLSGSLAAADSEDLRARVHDLEGRVRALAVSRRVLITLLVSADKKRKLEVTRLKAEVERLQERASKNLRAIGTRDAVIHRLRCRMAELVGEDLAGLEGLDRPGRSYDETGRAASPLLHLVDRGERAPVGCPGGGRSPGAVR